MEDAHQYPDKLVDVTDVANYLGNKYGGWYDVGEGVRHARQEVGRDHDGRRRQRARLPRKPREGRGLRRGAEGHGRLSEALPGAEGEGNAGRLRARQRDGRLELDALARLGARRQDGRREEQRRDQQPGDDRRARVLEAALRDVHSGHAVVARPEQQQGVPRRPARPHRERHLGLLRGQDVAGSEAAGDGEGHPARLLPGRPRRQAARAEPRVPDDDLQVHEVPERGQGLPALHDGEGAVRAVAAGVDRLRLPAARRRTSRARSGPPIRRTRRTATA